ncbi:hypothetical protein HY572_00500 [Candidatus Micrarchaeota archaeon]|nr:hypothetical protein [Candidatus Micrarchaeota archaeon]
MRLTVDANVFFAALIRSGLSRRILFHPDLDLSSPYFLLDEVRKYRSVLLAKSRLPEAEFDDAMALFLSQIELVPKNAVLPYVPAASQLVVDPKDWPYLACALAKDSEILSNDPHLHAQKRVTVYSVNQLAKTLSLIR